MKPVGKVGTTTAQPGPPRSHPPSRFAESPIHSTRSRTRNTLAFNKNKLHAVFIHEHSSCGDQVAIRAPVLTLQTAIHKSQLHSRRNERRSATFFFFRAAVDCADCARAPPAANDGADDFDAAAASRRRRPRADGVVRVRVSSSFILEFSNHH